MEDNKGQYSCVQIKWVNFHGIRLPNITGYLIRLFTQSKFDHAFVNIGNGKIVEAKPSGAVISDITEYNGCLIVTSHDPHTPVQADEIVANALSCVGTPYGFHDIIYLGLHILGLNWNWLMRRVLTEKRMICSQLVAYSGVKDNADRDWICGQEYAQEVTPGMLGKRPGVY